MSYQRLNPVPVIVAGNMSGNLTSKIQEVWEQDNIGIQLHWTGTPTGDFTFQISMDHLEDLNGNVVRAGNWVTLPLDPVISASGSADDAYVDINQTSARYVRVLYVATSGAGVLNVSINGKAV